MAPAIIDIGNDGGAKGGALSHVNEAGDALILNSMQLFVTNTGVTTFFGSQGGSVGDHRATRAIPFRMVLQGNPAEQLDQCGFY